MIGYLKGEVVLKDNPYVVLDVNGVGYRVHASQNVLSTLNKDNNKLKLFIHTHVRDDGISLFGFLDEMDLDLFKSLISVSGIGPKTAMAIFSVAKREAIIKAIEQGDVNFFSGVPRLGRKNALKVIIELKNKFGEGKDIDLSDAFVKANDEVISALKGFGFSTKEALEALKHIEGKAKTIEEKIRLALKALGRK